MVKERTGQFLLILEEDQALRAMGIKCPRYLQKSAGQKLWIMIRNLKYVTILAPAETLTTQFGTKCSVLKVPFKVETNFQAHCGFKFTTSLSKQ